MYTVALYTVALYTVALYTDLMKSFFTFDLSQGSKVHAKCDFIYACEKITTFPAIYVCV